MLKAAAMVKLTPKLIATEFPDEDLLSMHKLTLPGKGIEKVELLSSASPAVPRQSNLKPVPSADCPAKHLLTADQIGSQQQQPYKFGGRQPEHNTQVAVCTVQSGYQPEWHRFTEAATGAMSLAPACNLACTTPFATSFCEGHIANSKQM